MKQMERCPRARSNAVFQRTPTSQLGRTMAHRDARLLSTVAARLRRPLSARNVDFQSHAPDEALHLADGGAPTRRRDAGRNAGALRPNRETGDGVERLSGSAAP